MIDRALTLPPDAGVLTITGTGVGPELQVMVDGQLVTTLPGATDTQVKVGANRPPRDDAELHSRTHACAACVPGPRRSPTMPEYSRLARLAPVTKWPPRLCDSPVHVP